MATLLFHPDGCGSSNNVITLMENINVGDCLSYDTYWDVFPTGPAGGYEIQGMGADVSLLIRHGPMDIEICGPDLLLQEKQDGCYDINSNISERIWWELCHTGVDCPGVTRKRSESNGHSFNNTDGVGGPDRKHTGEIITDGVQPPTWKRADTTYQPPDNCFADETACQALADSGALKAICVDCREDYGDTVQASQPLACPEGPQSCPITETYGVSVTNVYSSEISFGQSIGDTGTQGTSSSLSFSFGHQIWIETSHSQSYTIQVPPGKEGYIGFRPKAYVGTVVTTSADGNVCDEGGLNKICGASPGYIIGSTDDQVGRYSFVPTN